MNGWISVEDRFPLDNVMVDNWTTKCTVSVYVKKKK